MAGWVPPKVDYWDTPRPVGGEDYKRIEGNLEWLYERTKYVIPSENILLQANTVRSARGSRWQKLKRLRVKHEGIYRVQVELQRNVETHEGQDYVNTYYPHVGVGVEELGDFDENYANTDFGNAELLAGIIKEAVYTGDRSTAYQTYNFEIYAPAGSVIFIAARHESDYYAYIRNAKVKGTVTTRGNVPDSAVLQD